MADAVVNILFKNLSTFLIQEASLLRGTRGSFEEIKRELDSMRSFLRDADRRKDGDEGLRTWVGQVRDAAYRVEDIIDEFSRHMSRPLRSGCTHYILQTIRLPKMIYHRHRLVNQLEVAKSQIAAISGRKDRYQLSRIEDAPSASYNATEKRQQRDGISAFMDSGDIVGLDEKINELVEWLTIDDPGRNVIGIVGMGGLGKTTLVARAYSNEKVRLHFECFAWISVSQSYRFEELLRGVIKDLFRANEVEPPSDLNSMSRIQLLRIVNEYLAMKRYVIIIDDVWRLEAWRELNVAFPRNKHGSRIMLTTRQENVAFGLGHASQAYQLEPLQEKEAWDLFCKNAFWKVPCPKDLEPLARRILRKCQGLPLAIVALGGLLSLREKTVPEWNRAYNDLSRQLNQSSELAPIKHILLLSFYDLPYNLKHCFLYCCGFPEDHLIYRKRLIRLWVAEGFVEDAHRITMEEAAEDYLKELVHRNMLQVVEMKDSGRFRCFRVHDIVREVALLVSQEEKFCLIYDGQQASRGEEFRRISIHAVGEITQLPTNMQHVRSVLVFDKILSFSSSFHMMASSQRFIRVLHLEGVPITCLPDEVTNLFNLRYLSLRNTEVSELPKSLGKLKNLQTLDLQGTKVESLPTGIGKLQKLRHLLCFRIIDSEFRSFLPFTGIKIPPQLCQTKSLQNLTFIEAAGEIAGQIGNLTELRKLGIRKVRAADSVELCASISKMEHLAKLTIEAIDEEETLELEALSASPPPLLQKLNLYGHLEKVPRWFGSLTILTHLWLNWSRLSEEEGNGLLLMLQTLPNLVLLNFRRTIEGQQLRFQHGWFPKLKLLSIRHFTHLNQVEIEEGSMPSLRRLYLVNCRELKTLPQGIEQLRELKGLYLLEMPMEFENRLRPRDGNEDYQKVAHIPHIRRRWKTENGRWNLEPLS